MFTPGIGPSLGESHALRHTGHVKSIHRSTAFRWFSVTRRRSSAVQISCHVAGLGTTGERKPTDVRPLDGGGVNVSGSSHLLAPMSTISGTPPTAPTCNTRSATNEA